MNQHLHIITLGVRDFKKSFEFYSKTLGWKASSNSNDDIAFFQAGGVVLAIYPREALAEDLANLSKKEAGSLGSLWHTTRKAKRK